MNGPLVTCDSPEQYELVLQSWARGWDAAHTLLKPRLDNLTAENDRLYLRANNKPEMVKKVMAGRVDKGLAEFSRRFFEASADELDALLKGVDSGHSQGGTR